ncbi:CPBP family intramembrane glutamic endopeptidase [Ruegeria arenilitoris]|uniref:CPBP family intramembrane glutamic endopeptidase n=1 Tax=Ruegeria arenilitoris TaxID=1173585 RepID=UPI00147B15F4|nr:type II CAAX endopeptidase family protein [Ruegeria arenilitoris]
MPGRSLYSAYSSHEQLVKAVRSYPELWRLLVGLLIIVIVVTLLNAVLFSTIASIAPLGWGDALQHGSTPLAVLIVLTSFIFTIFSVALVARRLQHRPPMTVVGQPSLAFRQFWRVLIALIALSLALFVLPPYDMGAPLQQNLSFGTWFLLLPLSVGAVLIQSSAEEILFRGFLQQSLAARFRTPVIWMGVPAILFAAGHYAPATAGDNALLVTVWAGIFSILTADLTARAGTLGPAIALHFFNNATALLLLSLPDNLGGLALFHIPYDASDTGLLRQWLYVDFAVMIVGWLTARLAIRR